MRRESSTVVVLVGQVENALLAELSRSPNVSIARAPADHVDESGTGENSGRAVPPVPGWEAGALAMKEAARRRSTYVIVRDDPLTDVAARWREMWDLSGRQPGAAGFEQSAAEALAAWRDKQFDLPDYYLVIAPAQLSADSPDLYLGPLRAARPHRVAIAGLAESPAQTAGLLDALRSLDHGPWWPPLDELLDSARHFYAGSLAAT